MPKSENLATIGKDVNKIFARIVLVLLILMAQFASFVDPFIILLAIGGNGKVQRVL